MHDPGANLRHDGEVAPRITPHRNPPIAFAHRGARAHAQENTIEAFSLALEMGAPGLESDVWITADGIVVLDHDGVVGGFPRRKGIASVNRSALPPHIPTLAELFGRCGTDFELSLDIKDPNAAAATVAELDRLSFDLGVDVAGRTWLCTPDWQQAAEWREQWPQVRIVDSTRLNRLEGGPERHAARLADAGIDAINMRQPDWTGGLTTLFHRFDVLCFGWDVQQPRRLREMFNLGIDALYSDHVDRMMDVHGSIFPVD